MKNQRRKVQKDNGQVDCVIEKVFFIPELLKSEGIPEQLRKNGKFMNEITSRSIIPVSLRFQKTKEMIEKINSEKSKALEFKVAEGDNKVEGYRFPFPKIFTSESNGFTPQEARLNVKQLAEKQTLDQWALVYDFQSEQNVPYLLKNLAKVAEMYKFTVNQPKIKLVFFSFQKLQLAHCIKTQKEVLTKLEY